MGTVIQTKFVDEEYDIDDGLVISQSQLVADNGLDKTATEVRKAVRSALKDDRFNRQPKILTNCVRVFYADTDEEKHHVDFPVYRKRTDDDGESIRELAGEDGWIQSDPTQVNSWFEDIVKDKNANTEGWGTQFRYLVQLLKRFCRSRKDWLALLPNGMKLTMLVAEVQPPYDDRIDKAFRTLLEKLENRLKVSKVIWNLAHPDQPMITRSDNDSNVCELLAKLEKAHTKLIELDNSENQTLKSARSTWDWMFKSNGFFKEFDEASSIQKTDVFVGHSLFDVFWREAPLWHIDLEFEVTLCGKYGDRDNGRQWQSFKSNSSPLEKHLYLRFHAQTNAPKPYSVFWQVVNTGSEAISDGECRGKIIASLSAGAGGLHSTSVPSHARDERTLYTGMHWVECFIVKKRLCVARSGPYVVNIK